MKLPKFVMSQALDGVNSLKTDLHICNLWTGQFVSHKPVIHF